MRPAPCYQYRLSTQLSCHHGDFASLSSNEPAHLLYPPKTPSTHSHHDESPPSTSLSRWSLFAPLPLTQHRCPSHNPAPHPLLLSQIPLTQPGLQSIFPSWCQHCPPSFVHQPHVQPALSSSWPPPARTQQHLHSNSPEVDRTSSFSFRLHSTSSPFSSHSPSSSSHSPLLRRHLR